LRATPFGINTINSMGQELKKTTLDFFQILNVRERTKAKYNIFYDLISLKFLVHLIMNPRDRSAPETITFI
jgi:hypothetical protein